MSDSFDFDLEVIAAARASGLAIGEAPIPTHDGDEISRLRPVRYGLRVLHVAWRFRRGMLRWRRPKRGRRAARPRRPGRDERR